MNVYQPHLLPSSLETPHVTIIIQDKDTNPKPFLVIQCTSRARKCITFDIPLLLRSMPTCIIDKIYTYSLNGFSNYTKQYMLAGYENSCQIRNCYMLKLACLSSALLCIYNIYIYIMYCIPSILFHIT